MSDEFEIVEEIDVNKLSRYIESSRDCRIGQVCEIGQMGHLVLNLSGIDPDECRLTMRRKSGNGMLVMNTGHASNNFRISSKVGQDVRMFMRGGKLELRRPNRSQGEIEVTSIILTKKVQKAVEWNKILDRATERSCIKLAGNKLMAAEGGKIVADYIGEVVTDPPNMFRKSDDGTELTFAGACEILEIEIKGPGQAEADTPQHIDDKPKPLQKQEEAVERIAANVVTPTQPEKRAEPIPLETESKYLLFDTDEGGFNRAFIVGSGALIPKQGLSLNPRAEYIISLDRVAPNSNYTIIVEARTLSGNGKLSAGIKPGNKIETQLVPRHKKTMKFRCQSGEEEERNFQFFLSRKVSATGELLIHRIMIMSSVPRQSMKQVLDQYAAADPTLSVSSKVHVDEEKDAVLRVSKQYARHPQSNYDEIAPTGIEGVVSTNSFCAASWFSKIAPLVPRMKRSLNAKNSDVCIGVPGCLTSAKRIFVEESARKLSEEDRKILLDTERIFTNSQAMMGQITETVPQEKTQLVTRLWPLPNTQGIPFIKGEFILVLNRHSEITKRILSCLPDSCPTVVVAGARGRYEKNVVPVNDYLPYRQLIWLMRSAKVIVDVQMMCEYKSGALDLCKFLNKAIVTNNWELMGDPDVDLVISDEQYENIYLPEPESISTGIESALDRKLTATRDCTEYNKRAVDGLIHMFR